jgi:hypothetical protein
MDLQMRLHHTAVSHSNQNAKWIISMMQHHRGYNIESKNGRHVARSTDGDDIAIHSIYLPRIFYDIVDSQCRA